MVEDCDGVHSFNPVCLDGLFLHILLQLLLSLLIKKSA